MGCPPSLQNDKVAVMGDTLKSFVRFLDSEKAVHEAHTEGPALRSFAQPSEISAYAPRLARSYLIETRTAIVEGGKAEIWSVGEIVPAGDGVDFKPDDHLAGEIQDGHLRCAAVVKEHLGIEITLPDVCVATELFEGIAAALLEKDSDFEQMRKSRGDEGAMQVVWMAFGAAVHDQLCRRRPIELETIGTFVPAEHDATVRFIADDHLMNLIAGHRARREFESRFGETVATVPAQAAETAATPHSIAGERPSSWQFLEEELESFPSDDFPLRGMIRDLEKKTKES